MPLSPNMLRKTRGNPGSFYLERYVVFGIQNDMLFMFVVYFLSIVLFFKHFGCKPGRHSSTVPLCRSRDHPRPPPPSPSPRGLPPLPPRSPPLCSVMCRLVQQCTGVLYVLAVGSGPATYIIFVEISTDQVQGSTIGTSLGTG